MYFLECCAGTQVGFGRVCEEDEEVCARLFQEAREYRISYKTSVVSRVVEPARSERKNVN